MAVRARRPHLDPSVPPRARARRHPRAVGHHPVGARLVSGQPEKAAQVATDEEERRRQVGGAQDAQGERCVGPRPVVERQRGVRARSSAEHGLPSGGQAREGSSLTGTRPRRRMVSSGRSRRSVARDRRGGRRVRALPAAAGADKRRRDRLCPSPERGAAEPSWAPHRSHRAQASGLIKGPTPLLRPPREPRGSRSGWR